MRKVREILRLTYEVGLPSREVARRVGVGSTGVRVMLQRFRASDLEAAAGGRDRHRARIEALRDRSDPTWPARTCRAGLPRSTGS
jgi:transposase